MNRVDALKAMDDLSIYLSDNFPVAGKVISYTQFIKRINAVFNADEDPRGIGYLTADSGTGNEDFSPFDEPAFGFDNEPAFGFDSAPDFGFESGADDIFDTPRVHPADERSFAEVLHSAYSKAGRRDISASELIRLVEAELNINGEAYYEIPTDPARYGVQTEEELANIIAGYLFLVSSGTKEWCDDTLEPSKARMAVQLNSTGNEDTRTLVRAIEEFAAKNFPEGYSVEIAGLAIIENAVTEIIVDTQILNILSSLLLVFLILTVYYRSIVELSSIIL